nr:copia protein [Tanacetum cinerariifolium]
MTSCDSIGTPIANKSLDADLSGSLIDQTKYHSMVGVLMYITASRLDIINVTCYCAHYQARPTEKHLKEVKRVFWYLKNTIHIGLWYPKDTNFELTAFSDSNHAGCLDTRKSTSGEIKFLGGDKLVNWSSKKQDCTFMSSAKADGGNKETKVMVFHKMDTKEVSDRFVAPCFVNKLEAYDGEINLGVEENMISNEYAVKLYLEHKVKRENKIVKKAFIVTLRSEIDFVKFIIIPEEYDVEPGVIFRRSFLRMTKAITDFGFGTITIYPDIDPFLEDTEEEEEEEENMDDWDQLLDFNLDDIPLLERQSGIRSNDCETRGRSNKKVKGDALKEKDDPRAFIFPIRLEGQVNKNALVDTGSDINTIPYRIYEQLGREEMKKVDKGITMINHTQAEAMGILTNVLFQVGFRLWEEMMLKSDHRDPIALDNLKPWRRYCFHKFIMISYYGKVETIRRSLEIDDMLRIKLCKAESNEEIFTYVAWIRAFNIKEPIYVELCHEFYSTYDIDEVCADGELQNKKIIKFRLGGRAHNLTLLEFAQRLGLYHADELEGDEFDVYFQGGLPSDDHFNAQEYWLSISREENLSLSRSHASTIRNSILRVIHKMITYGLCQRNTRVYSVLQQGAYNPPGYAQPQYDQQYPPLPLQYQQQQQRDNDE